MFFNSNTTNLLYIIILYNISLKLQTCNVFKNFRLIQTDWDWANHTLLFILHFWNTSFGLWNYIWLEPFWRQLDLDFLTVLWAWKTQVTKTSCDKHFKQSNCLQSCRYNITNLLKYSSHIVLVMGRLMYNRSIWFIFTLTRFC